MFMNKSFDTSTSVTYKSVTGKIKVDIFGSRIATIPRLKPMGRGWPSTLSRSPLREGGYLC